MTELIALLTDFTELAQDALRNAMLVFLRIGAAMALLPAFGEQSVPQRVRLVLALAFTAIVFPAVADHLTGAMVQGALPRVMVTETVAGLAIGIGLRLFVMVLQIAGTMAAQASSLAQLYAGAGAEPQPAMSHLFTMAGLAIAVAAGLHVQAAKLFILSYDLMPAGRLIPAADATAWGVGRIARAFGLAFTLAAPFVIAATIYNVALGVINRAMPQLMVVFVGAPALTLGGLVLLAVATPALLLVWLAALHGFVADPMGTGP
ncbi:MAG: flagellar biosynthetic protein FliR [Pseudorhodobacter sp.]